MPRLIRSAVLNDFVEVARSVGLDPYRMITEFHLPAACLTDSEIKISAGKVGRLFEAAAGRSGKIDFGLRLADRRTLSNLGALALLVREQPTIRKALEVLVGYMFLHSESLLGRLQEQNGLVVLSLAIEVDRPVPIRQSVELGIGFLHRSFQQLFRQRWKPEAVCLLTQRQRRETFIASSSVPRSGSVRTSTASFARRPILMRPCRRQIPRWSAMSSNTSTH
jgi:Arabinose-binding domain of AraC transcription regulator, N-term